MLGIVAFLYRLYPTTVVYEFAPTDDYVHYFYVTQLIDKGKPSSPGFAPQLMQYIIAGIYFFSLKNINLLWLCKCFNPVVGALTLIPFYYFCRKLTSENNALMASALFAVSDLHYYRSAYFGQSETLSMLFMFCFLALYVRQRYIWCGLPLVCMFYTHLLPFMVSMAFISFYYFVSEISVKRFMILVGLILGTALLVGGPFSSHLRMAQFINIQRFPSFFKVANLGVYSIGELWLGIRLMFGSVVLGLIVLYNYLRKPQWDITSTMFFVSLIGVVITWIGYDAAAMAPTRIAPYVGMSVIAMFSQIDIKQKKLITILLFALMFTGPVVFGGINTNLWVYDAATKEEVDALNYVDNNKIIDFGKTHVDEWFADRSISCIIWYKTIRSGDTKMTVHQNITRQGQDISQRQNDLETSNITATRYKYIFYSNRMKQRGFILVYDLKHHRITPERRPIAKPYIDPEKYKLIYEKDGVWIYERQ